MPDPIHARMNCMEVWGGNHATWSHFNVPGLDLWVYCQPVGTEISGGDVYYVSSCASGRVTRLLLGDVSGHGKSASPLSGKLRDIMRRNVNYIDQSRLVESVNEQFQTASSEGCFATAIISTFFSPTRSLTVCTAGHPPPLLFRTSTGKWGPLQQETRASDGNLPFGIVEGQQFNEASVRLLQGDMLLCYTDSLYEAKDPEGNFLKCEGLIRLANEIGVVSADFVPQFLDRIRALRPGNLEVDDTTVLLARSNGEGVPMKNNLMAPFRLLGGLLGLRK